MTARAVAPARLPLTVIHTAEPGAETTSCCEIPMPVEELWLDVEPRPGEQLCGGGDVQETLL